jgi:hypothetical protein
LTSALFYGAGMHHASVYSLFLSTHSNDSFFKGYMWGSHSSGRQSWDSEDDRRWRATTKAPYFENKVPGSIQ